MRPWYHDPGFSARACVPLANASGLRCAADEGGEEEADHAESKEDDDDYSQCAFHESRIAEGAGSEKAP